MLLKSQFLSFKTSDTKTCVGNEQGSDVSLVLPSIDL